MEASSLLTGIAAGCLMACAHLAPLQAVEPDERPNILWLTIEDTSSYMFGCYGNTLAQTPNVDALAQRGIRFTNANSNAPQCSPARSTLISGCYATHYGTDRHGGDRIVPWGRFFWPADLKKSGYFTSNNKKTHYNVIHKTFMEHHVHRVWDALSGKASYTSTKRRGRPFFAVFNNMSSHMSCLTTVTTDGRRPYRHDPASIELPPHVPDLPEMREDYALHLERVEDTDKWVGLHLEELKERHLEDDTIIFFYSDHGGCLPRGKAFPYETGYRVPLIIYVPEKWRHLTTMQMGTVSDRMVSFVDFGPTVLSLAGIEPADHYQGKPFMGAYAAEPRRYQHSFRCNTGPHYDPSRTTYDGRYKYIRYFTPYKPHALRQGFQWKMPSQLAWDAQFFKGECDPVHRQYFLPKPSEMLFDTQEDFWETNNLADDERYHEILVRLRAETSRWMRETRDLGLFHMDHRFKSPDQWLGQWVEENDYPLEALIEAAEIAGSGDPQYVDRLSVYLQDERPEFRFWGASGACTLLSRGLIDDFPGLEQAAEDGDSPTAVAAAEALCHMGNTTKGLAVLVELARNGDSNAQSALEELRDLAEEALPAIRAIASSDPGNSARWARSVLVSHGEMPLLEFFLPADIHKGMRDYRGRINWRKNLP